MLRVLVLCAALALPARAEPVARAAAVKVGLAEIAVGGKIGAAQAKLECSPSKVQHTVKKCVVKTAELTSTKSLGNSVDKVTLNVHFEGDVVNMSVAYAPGLSFDFL